MKVHYSRFWPVLLIALSATGLFTLFAEDLDPSASAAKEIDPSVPENLRKAQVKAVETYGQIVEASFMNSLLRAIELRKHAKLLVAKPTMENHILAKISWVQARLPYLQSEALFPYADSAASINKWPINPGYVDYVDGNPDSGIISNPNQFPDLSPEVLELLNGKDGITTGFHVIEFLLWGEVAAGKGRGKRTHDDYDAGNGNNAVRRGTLLISCCDHLVRHLAEQLADWKSGVPENARAKYEKLSTEEALEKIFSGISSFAARQPNISKPTGTKNIADQYVTNARFSGLGYIDLIHNAAGIANIATGAYVGIDGKIKVRGVGLIEMAEQVSPVRSERLRHYVNALMRSVKVLNSSLNRTSVHDGKLPEEGHSRIFLRALANLLKEINKLAIDLKP